MRRWRIDAARSRQTAVGSAWVPNTAISSGGTPACRSVAYDASAASPLPTIAQRTRVLLDGACQQALHEVALEREEHASGITSEMNEAGAMTSIDVPNSRSWPKIQTVIGCVFCPKVSATIRSFHVQRNWKIPSDAIAGRPSGRISRKKMRSSDAPSMRADSRMSFGKPDEEVAQQEDRERQSESRVEEDDPEAPCRTARTVS